MNEELKKKLEDAALFCTKAAAESARNEENPIDFAKSAELLTRAMLNLKNSEELCFGGEILEITKVP